MGCETHGAAFLKQMPKKRNRPYKWGQIGLWVRTGMHGGIILASLPLRRPTMTALIVWLNYLRCSKTENINNIAVKIRPTHFSRLTFLFEFAASSLRHERVRLLPTVWETAVYCSHFAQHYIITYAFQHPCFCSLRLSLPMDEASLELVPERTDSFHHFWSRTPWLAAASSSLISHLTSSTTTAGVAISRRR